MTTLSQRIKNGSGEDRELDDEPLWRKAARAMGVNGIGAEAYALDVIRALEPYLVAKGLLIACDDTVAEYELSYSPHEAVAVYRNAIRNKAHRMILAAKEQRT
jgi:hypothetical protein